MQLAENCLRARGISKKSENEKHTTSKIALFKILFHYWYTHFSFKHCCCEIIVLKELLLVEFEGVAIHYWNFSLGDSNSEETRSS